MGQSPEGHGHRLMRFPGAARSDPAVARWMNTHLGDLGVIAQYWFEVMGGCGDDVNEVMNDGHPVACVGDAAFAYVDLFTAHVNVGFFHGAALADPARLLQGAGRFMRHVKVRPGIPVDAGALTRLIEVAYADVKGRLAAP